MVRSQQRSKRSSSAPTTHPSAANSGPAEAVSVGAGRVAAAIAEPGAARSRDEWLAVVGDCQSLINTLTAVQDAAIAEAARRESVWCEDGTLGETVYSRGRVTLDAADVVAPVIGASHSQAQRRVEQAVRLAAQRVPVPADDRDPPVASGLGGLHQAMAAGQLDAYRAGVVAFELEVAPADVADAIVSALSGHLGDDSSSLRRRTRVLLSRISPDLVRERTERARAETGLRRWVAEPGVDEWHGTFPSEDAASAWAAIDRLAHDLVADGTCTNIEQARGKALTDLVTGNATVDVQIVLTVPADTHPGSKAPDLTAALVGADESRSQSASNEADGDPADATATTAACDEIVAGFPQAAATETLVGLPDARPTTPLGDDANIEGWQAPADAGAGGVPGHAPPVTAGDDDLVEVQGSRPSEPLLVRRAWLRDHLRKRPPHPRRGRPKVAPVFVPCDPLTGARLDPRDDLATDAYRPGAELAALVRARDGRCRFPGCCVAARFCDLDHVRPWSTGPTTATNLLTLCRRHHRIKQRPGWRLRLAPDGTATWTDPTGRERTTAPLNALHTLVLAAVPTHAGLAATPADPVDAGAAASPANPAHPQPPAIQAREPLPVTAATPDERPLAEPVAGSVWSALEHHLTFSVEHHGHPVDVTLRTHPTHRRCTSAAELRAGHARTKARAQWPDEPPF